MLEKQSKMKQKNKKVDFSAYIINIDEYKLIRTHCRALYVNGNNVTYFDSFGVEHIPKEIRKIIDNKNILTKIYEIQAYNLQMYIFLNLILLY